MIINVKREDDKGLIFSIQKFCIHDGPGVRTTVYMKGCSLRCKWCSNPESMSPCPEIMLFDMRCIKCESCIEACPKGAISFVDGLRTINWASCDECLKCAEACPTKAIEQTGTYISQENLLFEIEKDRIFYEESGGGVTFSGGEPLVQWKFILAVLKRCKERNIHTALDTTGNINGDIFEKVIKNVDLVLYDVKHLDTERHKEMTGIGNRLIVENLKNLKKMNQKAKVWLRIPIVPGYNDTQEFIRKLGDLAVDIRADKISLMPYHNLGEQKYERLGRIYPLKEVSFLQKEDVEKYKKKLQSFGLKVSIGS